MNLHSTEIEPMKKSILVNVVISKVHINHAMPDKTLYLNFYLYDYLADKALIIAAKKVKLLR